jgi:hypothetical protein
MERAAPLTDRRGRSGSRGSVRSTRQRNGVRAVLNTAGVFVRNPIDADGEAAVRKWTAERIRGH